MDFLTHREQFELQHPSSVPKRAVVVSGYPDWLKTATLFMFICAALLSGAHTVPTIYDGIEPSLVAPLVRDIVALSSFIAIELAIFISAYARLGSKSKTPIVILVVAFSVAVIANIHSTSKALGVNGADWGTVIVAFTSGIGAPLIALMAGELYVKMHNSDRRAVIDAEADYQAKCVVFDGAVLEAWNEAQRLEREELEREAEQQRQEQFDREERERQDALKAERRAARREKPRETPPVHEISPEVHENPASPKPRVKLHEVARRVHENGHENLSVAEMMEMYGISQGSTSTVRELAKSMNGHSQPAEANE